MWLDLVYALRSLRRSGKLSVVAILILALGIGSATAIASLVYQTLLRPLPFDDTRLVHMLQRMTSDDLPPGEVSFPDFLDWRESATHFDAMAAVSTSPWALYLRRDDYDQPVVARLVSHNFFDMLDVPPALGRSFLPEDGRPSADPVIVLSHDLWRRAFGADRDVVGSSVTVAARMGVSHMASELPTRVHTVVGVARAGFRFPDDADLWIAAGPLLTGERQRIQGTVQVIGRLKEGASLARARAEMHPIVRQLGIDFRGTDKFTVVIAPLTDVLFGPSRPGLYALAAAAGLLLLIACTNVAGLTLTHTTSRRAEVALRLALGAGTVRIARALLARAGCLALGGGVVGLFFAHGMLQVMVRFSPSEIPRLWSVGVDASALAVTVLLSGVAMGLSVLPSMGLVRSTRSGDVTGDLRGGSSSPSSRALGNVLVVGQLAMAAFLLSLAGLAMQTFVSLYETPLGFDPTNVLSMNVNLPSDRYPSTEDKNRFLGALKDRVLAVAGVEAASAVLVRPLEPGGATVGWDFWVVAFGQPVDVRTIERNPWVNWESVMPDYFRTMGIPIVAGRAFEDRDDGDAPSVVIVSRSLAAHMWPGEDPVGKRLLTYGHRGRDEDGNRLWQTIIGIAGDVDYRGLRESRMDLYIPYLQSPKAPQHVVIRTRAGFADAVSRSLRHEIAELDPELPAETTFPMSSIVSRALTPWRFNSYLFGVFAALALVLSAVGLFAVLAFTVAERHREIGVRLALGASEARVARLIVRQGLGLAVLGLTIGIVAANRAEHVLAGLVHAVAPLDPLTYVWVGVLLVAVAATALLVPSRAAARVDPARALRE